MEKLIVGYARVSTPTQRLNRQVDNLKKAYEDITVIAESGSGKDQNRPKWKKIMESCRQGKISKLVFDEVSRFGRNTDEAITQYKELFELGVELEFLKEPHINSEVFRQAKEKKISIDTSSMDNETANLINAVIGGLNDYLMSVAEKQIFLAFEHAERERQLLSQRTSEGLKQAKLLGSKVGRQQGEKIVTRKSIKTKKFIRDHYELLGGELTATQCIHAMQISKSTFYRYIDEMREADRQSGILWEDELVRETILSKEDITKQEILDIMNVSLCEEKEEE